MVEVEQAGGRRARTASEPRNDANLQVGRV